MWSEKQRFKYELNSKENININLFGINLSSTNIITTRIVASNPIICNVPNWIPSVSWHIVKDSSVLGKKNRKTMQTSRQFVDYGKRWMKWIGKHV